MSQHPARAIGFDHLQYLLNEAEIADLVNCTSQGPLSLYCYSRRAVYEKLWTPAALMARGLILDREDRALVATPFPKFFNVGEHQGAIPDLPFETLEKVDGSLIIIYWHRGEWKTA